MKKIFTDREREIRAVVYARHYRRNHPGYFREWLQKHPSYLRDYYRDYRRKNPEMTRKWTRYNYRRNRGTAHYKARKAAWQRKATAELRRCYVRGLILYGLPGFPIPEKLIELKEINLRIRREIWKNQKTLTS